MKKNEELNPKQITSPIDGTKTCYYETGPDGSESYLCMSSGYTTNSNFKKGERYWRQWWCHSRGRAPACIADDL